MRLRRRSTSRFSSCVSAHACVSMADEAAFQSKCTSALVRTASRPSFAALSAPRDVILTPDLSAHDDVVWFAWQPTRSIDVQRGCNAASAKLPPLIAARISKAGDCTPGGSFRRGPASGSASAGYADRGHVSRRLLQIQFPIVVHCSGCRRASVFVKYPLPKGHSIQPSSLKRPTHDSPGLAVSGYVSCFCDARSVKARARTRISETAVANVQGSSLANRNTVKRTRWNVFSKPTPGAAFGHVDDNHLTWSVAAWWHCRRQHREAVATQPHTVS